MPVKHVTNCDNRAGLTFASYMARVKSTLHLDGRYMALGFVCLLIGALLLAAVPSGNRHPKEMQ